MKTETKKIRFEGNGYGEEWKKEAKKRGLNNIATTPSALEAYVTKKTLHWTDEVFRICGYQPGAFEVTFEKGLEVIHPDDRDDFMTSYNLVCAGKGRLNIEHRIVLPSGEIRYIHERGELITNESGQGIALKGTSQDITERKQAERRYQHHNRILEMLLAKLPLDEVLNGIVSDVELLVPGSICSILLTDDSGTRLTHGAAPNLPDFYINAINGAKIGPATGSCGTASPAMAASNEARAPLKLPFCNCNKPIFYQKPP